MNNKLMVFYLIASLFFLKLPIYAEEVRPEEVTGDVRQLIDESKARIQQLDQKSEPPKIKTPKMDMTGEDTLYVYPEKKSYIKLSKIDINRFHCEEGDVTGVIFSEDKGLSVNRSGNHPRTYSLGYLFSGVQGRTATYRRVV